MKVEVRSQDGAREFAWRARVMFSEEKTHRVRRDGARELHGSTGLDVDAEGALHALHPAHGVVFGWVRLRGAAAASRGDRGAQAAVRSEERRTPKLNFW